MIEFYKSENLGYAPGSYISEDGWSVKETKEGNWSIVLVSNRVAVGKPKFYKTAQAAMKSVSGRLVEEPA